MFICALVDLFDKAVAEGARHLSGLYTPSSPHPPPPTPTYMKFRSPEVFESIADYFDVYFSLATSQVVAVKLYKLLNTAERLKHNHRNKSFNWCN